MKRLFLFASLLGGAASALAAPATSPTSGLGFDVATRVASTGKSQIPPQTIKARVLLSGTKARIETQGAGGRAVVLYTPPFVYRLLPDSKAGVKWKLSKVRGSEVGGFDPQQLLRNPDQIRTSLIAAGAKKKQSTSLGGTPVDLFELSRPGQRFSNARAWLRRSDSLPVRLETSGGGLKVVVSWSGYKKLPNVNATQFAPPKGFAIREAQNPPLLPIL